MGQHLVQHHHSLTAIMEYICLRGYTNNDVEPVRDQSITPVQDVKVQLTASGGIGSLASLASAYGDDDTSSEEEGEEEESCPMTEPIHTVAVAPATDIRQNHPRQQGRGRGRGRGRGQRGDERRQDSRQHPYKKHDIKSCKPTLLAMLLAPDIRHERNIILQCVRYVVQNDFFQGVVQQPS